MVPGRPQVLARMLTPRRHRDPAYARRIAADLYGGTMRDHPERAADGAARRGPRAGPTGATTTSCWPASAGAACRCCGLIRQPTLIVAGDDDPIIPTINAKIMHAGIPRTPGRTSTTAATSRC